MSSETSLLTAAEGREYVRSHPQILLHTHEDSRAVLPDLLNLIFALVLLPVTVVILNAYPHLRADVQHGFIFKYTDFNTECVYIVCAGCQNVRNRNVTILARSSLKLRSLSIGHSSTMAYGKPRITNQARAATMHSLVAASVHVGLYGSDCV